MSKVLKGSVVSVKMHNTVVVSVVTKRAHPLYKKILKRTKNYKVDSTGKKVSVGDLVQIVETKPISKDKHFKLWEGKKK